MKTLITILLILGSTPSLTEAAVGISDVKLAVNAVSFTPSSLDARYDAKDRVALEQEAIDSRRLKVEQLTGADDVLGHVEFTTEAVSLHFQF